MSSSAGLQLDYLSLADCKPDEALGLALFGPSTGPSTETDIPVARVSARLLTREPDVCELWRATEPVQAGRRNAVRYRCTEQVLFGSVSVAESDLPSVSARRERTALHQATEQVYREMLAAIEAAGYPYLVRVWNYLSDINTETHGIERYRQFNRARQEALQGSGRAVAGAVPAACALGTPAGSPLVVYFLASRSRPTFIENPRQVSAYDYPPEYGARSPVFSRATALQGPAGWMLFISGTASIVGHRTVHAGDAAAQTRETLTNIQALIEEASRRTHGARFTLGDLACKIYVRDPADLPLIQRELQAALGSGLRAIYLQADICRRDLLVEIEATGPGLGACSA